MQVRLHANAATTPKTRAYIQQSSASAADLAVELGVSETTVRRWKNRTTVEDGSHTPKRLAISLTPIEEELVLELWRKLALPLDDITEVMKRCVRPMSLALAKYQTIFLYAALPADLGTYPGGLRFLFR